jgi:acyl-CoA synthetase (NDP forming)
MLPKEASVSNPVDMIASATAQNYGQAVRCLGESKDVDAVIVVFNTPLLTRASDVADELVAARGELSPDVAVIAVFMNADGPPRALREAGIASFVFPENAARALGRSVGWDHRRGTSLGKVLRPEVDIPRVRRLMAAASRESKDGWLRALDAEALLGEYAISVPRTIRVRTPGEAEAAQAELGCTVVVKVAAAIHKSEVGGVRLGARTPAAAAGAVLSIRADLENAGRRDVGDEFLVQEQVGSGLEMIVGLNRDRLLGPLVMVGLGGGLVEVLGDVAVRLAPLSDDDIVEMLHSLRSYPLLTGYRGEPCLDVGALCQVLQGVSALAEDLPEIEEMDLNPVLVLEKGAVAVDVRTRVTVAF